VINGFVEWISASDIHPLMRFVGRHDAHPTYETI
jgi:hypothetical protein